MSLVGISKVRSSTSRSSSLLGWVVFSAVLATACGGLPQDYPSVPMYGLDFDSRSIRMPLCGVGTWLYNDTLAQLAVGEALQAGYRHVDTALTYDNQRGVGQALAAAGLAREEFFVTSKIPGAVTENASDTRAALEQCLEQLQLDYVDLMLIHWPGKTITGRQTQWKALEQWAREGKARAIGVSHYCKVHVEELNEISSVPIALNQNQYHVGMGTDTQPRLHDKAYMESKGILFMAYSSLCGPCPPPDNRELVTGDLVTSIGRAHNKSGAQVALRWVVQQGYPVIPKSSNPEHLRANLDIFDFTLSEQDMAKLRAASSPPETGTPQAPDDAQDCRA